MLPRLLRPSLALLLALTLGGCDSLQRFFKLTKEESDPIFDAGPPGDGDGDGGDGDRTALDAGPDGGEGDGDGSDIDVLSCQLDARSGWDEKIPSGNESSFSLTRGLVGFGLAYRPQLSGQCEQVFAATVPATGPFPLPPPVVGNDDCNVLRDLALLYTDATWWLGLVDNRAGTTELHLHTFDDALGAPDGAPRRLTDDGGGDEHDVVLAPIQGAPFAAWATEHIGEDTHSLTTLSLDGDTGPVAVLDRDPDARPTRVALSQMGADAAAIAWVDEAGDPGVYLQPLDADAAPVGAPQQLNGFVHAGSSVDLATRSRGAQIELGGAAIYSIAVDGVGREVRYRRIDAGGAADGPERTIVGAPLQGSDASIAPLGGGYIVAYRALPGGDVETPEIRLAFVTREGETLRDGFGRLESFPLAEATMAQARTTVRVSTDGQILVAWLDRDADGDAVLKLSRRRLDCD